MDVSETILCGTIWTTSQLRGRSRAGSDGRAQIRRGNGGSKFPGVEAVSLSNGRESYNVTKGEKSIEEGEGDEGIVE